MRPSQEEMLLQGCLRSSHSQLMLCWVCKRRLLALPAARLTSTRTPRQTCLDPEVMQAAAERGSWQ